MLAPIEDASLEEPGTESSFPPPEYGGAHGISPAAHSPAASPLVTGGSHSSPMMGHRFSDSSVNRQLTEPLVPGQRDDKIEL